MQEKSDLEHGEAGTAGDASTELTVESAATELADRLKALADDLAAKAPTRRIRYGKGRLGNSLKRRSPEGFVLDDVNLQMLLPDGRLWTYSRSDAARHPAGRYLDIRTDYRNFAGGRSFFGGSSFTFLGAVLGKYTFGLAESDDGGSGRLCALCGEGSPLRYVDADEAFADIANSVVRRESGTTGDRAS